MNFYNNQYNFKLFNLSECYIICEFNPIGPSAQIPVSLRPLFQAVVFRSDLPWHSCRQHRGLPWFNILGGVVIKLFPQHTILHFAFCLSHLFWHTFSTKFTLVTRWNILFQVTLNDNLCIISTLHNENFVLTF